MQPFPPPPAADPLYIFGPHGPIAAAFMRVLLASLLPTQPPAAPDQQDDHRQAAMSALAALRPENPMEAMLAAQMVAANARVMTCFALAAAPDTDPAEARRLGAQASSLMRAMQEVLRGFGRIQATRRKDEEQPSERTGYWFRDASVPAPEEAGTAEEPMHREAAAAATPRPAARRQGPVASGEALPEPMMTGDAMMRFASSRLEPEQTVEAAWARAVTDAAAEAAEASR